MAFDVDGALMRVIENEGSDLHVKVPAPPLIRRHEHVGEDRVAMDGALKAATHPLDFKLLLQSDGQRPSAVGHVVGDGVPAR